jgi:hypothetical protein
MSWRHEGAATWRTPNKGFCAARASWGALNFARLARIMLGGLLVFRSDRHD